MPKDAYYFSHDANAHTDPKILKLRMALGWEGYGIYWAIIENLRCQENYSICESEFMFLTLSLAIDEAKLKQVLSKCLEVNLLQVIDSKVLSPSLLKRMEKADEIRNKRKIAGAKGGKAKANAKATLKQNSSIKGKEKKGKEIKEDIKDSLSDDKSSDAADWLKKANPVYLRDCENFYKILMEKDKITKSQNWKTKTWHDGFRLLIESDGIDYDKEFKPVMNFYIKNIGKQFCPEAYSPTTVRTKWVKLRDYMNKEKNKSNSNLSTRP